LLFTDILDDAYVEMIPLNKAIRPSKGEESTLGDRAYIETVLERFRTKLKLCNRCINSWVQEQITVETYNPKYP
jgi:hypothetical protein